MKKARRYTEDQAIALLRDAIGSAGSQAAFAKLHGISQQYITDVLKRRRSMGRKILDAIDLCRITEFECKSNEGV